MATVTVDVGADEQQEQRAVDALEKVRSELLGTPARRRTVTEPMAFGLSPEFEELHFELGGRGVVWDIDDACQFTVQY